MNLPQSISPWVFTIILLWTVFSASGLVMLKYVLNEFSKNSISNEFFSINTFALLATNRYFIAALLLYCTGLILCVLAMTKTNVSFLAPFGGALTFILTAIFASIFLKEKISNLGWIGIAIICIGLWISTYGYSLVIE